MKETAVITSEEVKDRVCELVVSIPFEPRHEIIIRPVEKNQSASQRGLYWMWITTISDKTGETKDEVHFRMKKKHLVRIFERDDPDGYGQMICTVRDLHKQGMKTESKLLAEQIVKLTSTTAATVAQMMEYMTDLEHDVWEQGIVLPHPEDRYLEALGR